MTRLYELLLRPLLFAFDPEAMRRLLHRVSVPSGKVGARYLLRRMFCAEYPALTTEVAGITFPNPIGLAAGFDTAGDMLGVLPYLGFGFMEVGSVTRRPWAGNPHPRLFRLPQDEAIINRMGFNNPGADAVAENLAKVVSPIPVGVNVAKTPDPQLVGDEGLEDFVRGVLAVYHSGRYLALNIRCPNTAEGNTFEDAALLDLLLSCIRAREQKMTTTRPIFVKLSPDISPATLDGILEQCTRWSVDGLIICNTTTVREGLQTPPEQLARLGHGGLSGRPLFPRALAMVQHVYRTTGGRLPIIGCGGIASADDAYRYFRAGASLVQLYTGMIYHGPWLMRDMNRQLVDLLDRDGVPSLSKLIGVG